MLKNTATHYGVVTKSLHWAVFALIAYQFFSGNLMTHLGGQGTLFGLNQDHFYDWHKSVGLVVFFVALARIAWRRMTPLPEWFPALTPAERAISQRLETALYVLMFALPITGYAFVMAGDYGVRLFRAWDLPNPIGKRPGLALTAQVLHIVLTYAAVVLASWHIGLGLKKHFYEGTRFLRRMLPFTRH